MFLPNTVWIGVQFVESYHRRKKGELFYRDTVNVESISEKWPLLLLRIPSDATARALILYTGAPADVVRRSAARWRSQLRDLFFASTRRWHYSDVTNGCVSLNDGCEAKVTNLLPMLVEYLIFCCWTFWPPTRPPISPPSPHPRQKYIRGYVLSFYRNNFKQHIWNLKQSVEHRWLVHVVPNFGTVPLISGNMRLVRPQWKKTGKFDASYQ